MVRECSLLRGLSIRAGEAADYRRFERFHYRAAMPRGVVRVFLAGLAGEAAGIIVETVPPLNSAARERVLGAELRGLLPRERACFLNQHLATIARVVVHPRFRGIGVGLRLVKHLLQTAQTPCVETFASMGRVHPLFERGGMRRIETPPARDVQQLAETLASARLQPLDLVNMNPAAVPAEVAHAMRRLSRNKGVAMDELIRIARHRLLAAPVYYFWRKEDSCRRSLSVEGGKP